VTATQASTGVLTWRLHVTRPLSVNACSMWPRRYSEWHPTILASVNHRTLPVCSTQRPHTVSAASTTVVTVHQKHRTHHLLDGIHARVLTRREDALAIDLECRGQRWCVRHVVRLQRLRNIKPGEVR
jgi:hypothetical protein